MPILIVAATAFEIQPLIDSEKLNIKDQASGISVLITGVGMVAAAFELGRHLALNKYDLAINLGIAGSFDRAIALGEVTEITADTLAELGAEDNDQFISIEDLGFGESVFKPDHVFKTGIKKVSAITVNTVHGHEPSIGKIQERLNPQLESMEGAAFFYACGKFNIPCMQIRAVSNYVEKRNRDSWNIPLAIKNLNNFAIELVGGLCNR